MCLNDFLDGDRSLTAEKFDSIFLKKLLIFLANFRLSPENGVAFKNVYRTVGPIVLPSYNRGNDV